MSDRPVVFQAMPHYGPIEAEAGKAFWCNASADADTLCLNLATPLLAHGFNQCWCSALNVVRKGQRIDYFVMLHADIVPEEWWIDKLIAEMVRTGADLVSCVVPIKSAHGVTSTAIAGLDPWVVERRLTMREVMQLPETFGAADCGFPGRALMVNTGCWIADFRKPWVEQVRFQISNRIVRTAAGFDAQVVPEDWDFARQIVELEGLVLATRKVSLAHIGPNPFRNQTAWGSYRIDHMAKGRALPPLRWSQRLRALGCKLLGR
jgi:hypothetical protein